MNNDEFNTQIAKIRKKKGLIPMLTEWIEKYKQRRWIRTWLGSPQIKNSHAVLSKLYKDVNAHLVSKAGRETCNITDPAYTYGEIDFFSFAAALKVCEPQPGEIFYDIGSGAGKVVFASALLYDFSKVCGIESLNALHQLCLERLDVFPALAKKNNYFENRGFNIQFIGEDLVNTAFTDADIVFINATCYMGELWENLYTKINQLKMGTRIILASKHLPSDHYAIIDAQIAMTSWGNSSVFIYQKLSPSSM